MTFFYKKRRARWHKEWGSEWYRIRWPWWIWALILPFKSHMTLSKSYSLSLLIKWKKRISQIHRNFERIKLDNINEKSSEIINTCKQRLGSWVYWKQTTTLNLSAPFFKLKCKKKYKALKMCRGSDITGWIDSELKISIQIGQPVYIWENFHSNGNISLAHQQP